MIKIVLVIFLSLVVINAADGKCRALALEGGGDRGAYHAGAMSKMYDLLPKEEYQYDVCSGISAGSLNCAAWGLFPKGMEQQQVEFMNMTWETITRKQVFKEWDIFPIYGLLDGLMNKPGLFNNQPLRDYLEGILGEYALVRNVSFGAADMDNNIFQRWHLQDLPTVEDQINAVISSAAIPMFFPHNDWNNSSYSDGGTMNLLDIEGAIDVCVSQGYAQEDIILDAIYCLDIEAKKKDISSVTTLGMALRTIDIFAADFLNSGMRKALDKYPDVDYRYFVIPPLLLDYDLFMTFNHDVIMKMMVSGSEEAEKIVNAGPNGKRIVNAVRENREDTVREIMLEMYHSV